MFENKICGTWVKYAAEPGNWSSKDTTYHKLYSDLENSNAGWDITESLTACGTELCGEFRPSLGTKSGDIYIYYEENSITGESIPKIYLKVELSFCTKENWIKVRGSKMILDENEEYKFQNFNVEPRLLPLLISKLKELNANKGLLEYYQNKVDSFAKLTELSENGIKSEEDLIFLYRNFNREDTILARKLMAGRNVQADYDCLSDENKIEFLNIICAMNNVVQSSTIEPLDRLKTITSCTDTEHRLLQIEDKEILFATATKTELRCLEYATDELLADREFLLELFGNFEIRFAFNFDSYIPEQFRTDLEILQAVTKTIPSSLCDIIRRYSNEPNSGLREKLEEHDFTNELLTLYFNNILADECCGKRGYVNMNILHCIPVEGLMGIENEILCGPQPTAEREKMKCKIYTKAIKARKNIVEHE